MSRDLEQLLKSAIRFLEIERELYGEFSLEPPGLSDKRHSSGSGGEFPEIGLDKRSGGEFPEVKQDKRSGASSPELLEETPEKQERSRNAVTDAAPSSGSGLSLAERLKTCSTLDELRELCSAMHREQGLSESPMVFGSGHEKSKLMLVAHTPGSEDLQTGAPFSGEAGRLLDKILAAIHFRRQDLYLTHLLKQPVPEDRQQDSEERELNELRREEHQTHLLILERQIELINPGLILCLGRQAAAALIARDDSMEELRGRFHQAGSYEVLITYHPQELLDHPEWKRPTWEDVQLLRRRYDQRFSG